MNCGDSAKVAWPIFHSDDGGSNPTSPLQFKIIEISTSVAVGLNRSWHSRLPEISNPYGDNICFAAEFYGKYYAVAIWTRPIARMFNGKNYLELRRYAICKDAPKNTASRMMSVMIKKIKILKPHIVKLISYQDTDVHIGTIYKASGWIIGNKLPCTINTNIKYNWGCKSRKRKESQSPGYKIRWERLL